MIMYTYINRPAGTPNKTKTKDTMSLDYSSVCYIWSDGLPETPYVSRSFLGATGYLLFVL